MAIDVQYKGALHDAFVKNVPGKVWAVLFVNTACWFTETAYWFTGGYESAPETVDMAVGALRKSGVIEK